jgi:hypothetical protein
LREIPGGREEITRRAPYQQSLFSTREPNRVVPIGAFGAAPALAPRRPRARAEERQQPTPGVYQQTFEWTEPVRRAQAAQEAIRYCDAPVATPMHRAAAAVLDCSLVLIAVGVVMSLLHAGFGDLILNARTLPYFAVLAGLFGVGYKVLWAMAGMDSPGLRWVQLQLLNFDGRPPARNERMGRIVAGCLSVLSGGLGLLWSLADEETLSWHDHMSKTFLTLQLRQEVEE